MMGNRGVGTSPGAAYHLTYFSKTGIHRYKEVIRFISICIRDANYDNEELMAFRPKVSEADFLFGEDVPKYIDELHKRAVNRFCWNKECRDYSQPKPESYNHQKVVGEIHQELLWVTSQLEPARNIFKKYLNVSQ
jgi:hypothetical protein